MESADTDAEFKLYWMLRRQYLAQYSDMNPAMLKSIR